LNIQGYQLEPYPDTKLNTKTRLTHHTMKRLLIAAVIFATGLWACSTVPITGRKQLLLIGDGEMNAMALTSYKSFLDTSKVVPMSSAQTQMVKRVGDRIARAAQQYFNEQGQPDYLAGYNWQVELVESPDVNAWCMPGGKMVVYTGILPVCQTEAGLAVVMGHEVSHAVARHGSERMSEGLVQQVALVGGQIALQQVLRDKPAQTQLLWNSVYGTLAPAAVQLGYALPHSRNQELEADHLGIIFSSIAGYNPEEAVTFWQRMGQLSNGKKPPLILSTHPSDEQRVSSIQKLMPEAMKYYAKSQKRRL
jgi:predicted Zn-dependent protease